MKNFLLLGLLLASTAHAQELDDILTQMQTQHGQAYLDARAVLVQHRDRWQKPLLLRVQQLGWSAASWQNDAIVAVAQSWTSDPQGAANFYDFKALQPQRYLQRRRPEPNVSTAWRSDVQHGLLPPALLLELYLRTGELQHLPAVAAKALHAGMIVGLGASDHPAAPFVLREILANAHFGDLRRTAASALATTQSPLALPALLQAHQPYALRAMGLLHSEPALEVLLSVLRGPKTNPEMRSAAVGGLGILGSTWTTKSAALRNQAEVGLLEYIVSDAFDDADEETVVAALSSVATPETLVALQSLQAKHPALTSRFERLKTRVALTVSRL